MADYKHEVKTLTGETVDIETWQFSASLARKATENVLLIRRQVNDLGAKWLTPCRFQWSPSLTTKHDVYINRIHRFVEP